MTKLPKSPELESERVIVKKQMTIQGYSPEQELRILVDAGDWELVLTAPAYQKRSVESQGQLIAEALTNRARKLEKILHNLVNKGPSFQASAMGVLGRIKQLRDLRDQILKKIYEQMEPTLDERAGIKKDWYA